jgi:heme exporter protein B
VRIGGGAMMGVLFFLSVVTVMAIAIGPALALLWRAGPRILWSGPCRDCRYEPDS